MDELTEAQTAALATLLRQARAHVEEISQDASGIDAYVVGGAVRDALMGTEPKDLDFVVVGSSADELIDRGFRDIEASSFGVLHDDRRAEWALARTETKAADGYKGIEVETEDVSLREDLERRDLRCNAMALRLFGGVPDGFDDNEATAIRPESEERPGAFVDPFGGALDIASGRLQHVSDAFAEDPLRVLRVARYAARFEYPPESVDGNDTDRFSVPPETKALMRRVAPELNRMSRDRIGEEVAKAMHQAVDPRRFWDVLREVGALAVLAPTLDRASIVPAGPDEHHRESDTYEHTMMVLERMHEVCEAQGITGEPRVRRYLMAVAHDLGKIRVADTQGGLWSDNPPVRFPGHAERGASVAATLGRRLGLGKHRVEAMRDAAELHMAIHDLPSWSPERLVEFVADHDPEAEAEKPHIATMDELVDLAHADHEGRWKDLDVAISDRSAEEYPAAPENAYRPAFDRERFRSHVATARDAIEGIDGYEVMREGLCATHEKTTIEDEDLARVMSECESCRSLGNWIDTRITERRRDFVGDNRCARGE